MAGSLLELVLWRSAHPGRTKSLRRRMFTNGSKTRKWCRAQSWQNQRTSCNTSRRKGSRSQSRRRPHLQGQVTLHRQGLQQLVDLVALLLQMQHAPALVARRRAWKKPFGRLRKCCHVERFGLGQLRASNFGKGMCGPLLLTIDSWGDPVWPKSRYSLLRSLI